MINVYLTGRELMFKPSCRMRGNVKVLEHSYRVPAKVHALADKIVNRIQNRQEKTWTPREEQGEIHYYNHFEHVDISKGEWLVMASTNYMLNDMYTWIKSQGLLFRAPRTTVHC